MNPVRAEKLLTQLAVHERTRIEVDDDAEIRYSMSPEIGRDTSRVRIGPGAPGALPGGTDSTEDQFRALEEAEAALSGGEAKRTAQLLEDEDEAKKLATAPFGRGPSR